MRRAIFTLAISLVLCGCFREKYFIKRYSDAENKLVAPGYTVFVGDSIIQEWEDVPGVNRGTGAEISADVLVRFQRDAISLHPARIVLLIGTNDLLQKIPHARTVANITRLVVMSQRAGVPIVLCSVTPYVKLRTTLIWELRGFVHSLTGIGHLSPNEIRERVTRLNVEIGRMGAPYVDYYSAMTDSQGWMRRDLTTDGFHPNHRGYAVMRAVVLRTLVTAAVAGEGEQSVH